MTGVDHKTGQRHSFVDPAFLASVDAEGSSTKSAWWLCQYVTERRRFLLEQLERVRTHGQTALKVNAVGRTAQGGFFVELHNAGGAPVSLEGLHLTGDPRRTTQWTLPAVSLPPGGTVRFTQGAEGLEGLGATLEAARPEVGLFAADGRTALDLLFLPPLQPGRGYTRAPSGSEHFAPLP
jgi:spore coat protein H